MSVNEVKERLESMSAEERHEVAVFLAKMEISDDEGYWERVRRRAEDSNPDHWVSIDELTSKSV